MRGMKSGACTRLHQAILIVSPTAVQAHKEREGFGYWYDVYVGYSRIHSKAECMRAVEATSLD